MVSLVNKIMPSCEPIMQRIEVESKVSIQQNEIINLQDTSIKQVNMGRYNTCWKRRVRNINEQAQDLSGNSIRSKKRSLIDRMDPSEELQDDTCPKKAKSTE